MGVSGLLAKVTPAGGGHRDADQLSGNALESTAYTYDGGPVDHSSINSYWVSAPVASRARTGLPPLTANATGKAETWARQAVSGGWCTNESDTSYDTDSQLNKLTAPTGLNRAADVAMATRTFYDNPTMVATWPQPAAPTWPQAAPTKGDQSVLQVADGYSGGAFTHRTEASTLTDGFGKPSRIYDGAGHATATSYTRTSYLTATGLTVTNTLGQNQVTTLDPTRGLTPSGERIRMTAVTPLQGEADMHDLTVADLHTYYVVAGGTPVLVHNICPPTKIVLGVDGPENSVTTLTSSTISGRPWNRAAPRS
ncbi:hypothetical protein HUT16_04570 [Kitasatospora sp. NA04385]|uniref:hypothetical protein n=1 Tax=Kitasatospora sp. NA04385 TaxID=2742135 RepID=UPI001592336C|nr:hypothetical protein [Kitasatospora sp. NA04385]QKW18436.1 hypothetical protein HUT16_04570 [Kitasatospora sp. NA04385]